MESYRGPDPPLWISGTDEQNRTVDQRVINAAHRIWKRVLNHVRREGHDVDEAAETMEKAVHSVSRAITRQSDRNSIRSMDAYLFWSFVRRFNRLLSSRRRIRYVESSELLESLQAGRQDWVRALDNKLLMEEVLSHMDMKTRRMLVSRALGHSWAEIGRELGISAHNAEVQFGYGVRKVRQRLLKSKPSERQGKRRRG